MLRKFSTDECQENILVIHRLAVCHQDTNLLLRVTSIREIQRCICGRRVNPFYLLHTSVLSYQLQPHPVIMYV